MTGARLKQAYENCIKVIPNATSWCVSYSNGAKIPTWFYVMIGAFLRKENGDHLLNGVN